MTVKNLFNKLKKRKNDVVDGEDINSDSYTKIRIVINDDFDNLVCGTFDQIEKYIEDHSLGSIEPSGLIFYDATQEPPIMFIDND